jgi:hypothetical protein
MGVGYALNGLGRWPGSAGFRFGQSQFEEACACTRKLAISALLRWPIRTWGSLPMLGAMRGMPCYCAAKR